MTEIRNMPLWVREQVEKALAAYDGDPELGHAIEDDTTSTVIRYAAMPMADGIDVYHACRELLPLLDADVTRWFA
jgi:hypothetical protein